MAISGPDHAKGMKVKKSKKSSKKSKGCKKK